MLNQLLSNRVEKTPSTEVSADRYEYLALAEAEPDLGVPAGNSYILASTTTGTRSWVNPATNLTAPGSNTQVVFNNSGVLAGAASLVYDTTTGRVGIGVASPTSRLDIAETWNNAGTAFTLIKADVTDTASASTSLIVDFQVSSSTKVYIDKTGLINATGFLIGATTPGAVTNAHGFTRNGNNLYVYTAGTLRYNFSTSSFNTSLPIGFGTSLTGPDAFVLREAANTIAQRNGLNTQIFRLYNTYTDASNYERASISWNSNVLEFGSESAGTGTLRTVRIKSGGTTEITGGTLSVPNGGVTLGASAFFFAWSGRSRIGSSADGILSISNSAGTGFDRLQIGGATNSFPSLKRNSTSLEVKLADDSAFTGIKARELNTENTNQTSEATTLATTSKTQVASFPVASFRSGKLIVQAYDSVTGEVQISELLVAHNGSTASATEYGVVYTGSNSIVTYDVDISAGNVRLMATRTTANSTQYKISETLMVA